MKPLPIPVHGQTTALLSPTFWGTVTLDERSTHDLRAGQRVRVRLASARALSVWQRAQGQIDRGMAYLTARSQQQGF